MEQLERLTQYPRSSYSSPRAWLGALLSKPWPLAGVALQQLRLLCLRLFPNRHPRHLGLLLSCSSCLSYVGCIIIVWDGRKVEGGFGTRNGARAPPGECGEEAFRQSSLNFYKYCAVNHQNQKNTSNPDKHIDLINQNYNKMSGKSPTYFTKLN